MRLEDMGLLDPLHTGVGQAQSSRHGAHAPLGRARWFLMERHVDHPLDHRCREGLAPRRVGGTFKKPCPLACA